MLRQFNVARLITLVISVAVIAVLSNAQTPSDSDLKATSAFADGVDAYIYSIRSSPWL
jgi:predicted naringenin-chalcone synthase